MKLQYYTFLSKEPHRLHCFYKNKSKFLHGTEGESLETQEGQKAIHQRILELDFQDCKVLVSNVDSQPSHDGCIVIMVLGEMSNKGGASHKFAQTFVLAQQTSGYFVYNDMFRFLKEDIDNEYEEPVDPVPDYNDGSVAYEESTVPEIPAEVAPESVASVRSPSPVKELTKAQPPEDVVEVEAQEEPLVESSEHFQTQENVEPKWETEAPEPVQKTPAQWTQPQPKAETSPEPKRNPSPVRAQETRAPAPVEDSNPKPKSWAGVATANTHNWTPEHVSPAKGQVTAIPAGKGQPPAGQRQGYNQGNRFQKTYNDKQQHAQQQSQPPAQPASAPKNPAEKTSAAGEDERSSSPQAEGGEFREVQNRRLNHDNRNNRPHGPQGERQNTGPSEDVIKRSICLKSIEGLTKDAIKDAFSKVGKVVDVVIPTGKPNMAFIEFDNQAAAQDSIGKSFVIGKVTVHADVRRPKSNNMNNRNYGDNRGGHAGRGRGTGNRDWNQNRRQNGNYYDPERKNSMPKSAPSASA
ncbi:hypothetical protein HDU96_004357 [Phlyctochytrium bullatum]|nr:hypothetical protein HDU96_004357 [Phlyctochytrium bullatum]